MNTARCRGIVTLEDILSEIIGELPAEHEAQKAGVRKQADGSYVIEGSMPVRDLNRMFDWGLPEEEATTLAGLVIHEARTIPRRASASPSTASPSRSCGGSATRSRR